MAEENSQTQDVFSLSDDQIADMELGDLDAAFLAGDLTESGTENTDPSEGEPGEADGDPEEEENANEDPEDEEPDNANDDESDAEEEGDPDSDSGDDPADDTDDSGDDSDSADAVDHKGFFEKVTGEFKANGKMMKVDNADDAIRLMQMGANYNQKMASLKPSLKALKMLEKNDLLSEEKLGFLIDLDQKSPEAIAKLLADSKIDPLTLDMDKAENYEASDHSVNEAEIELDSVVDELKSSPHFDNTMKLVTETWDDSSKQEVANAPELLKVIDNHMASGIYDLISTQVAQERMFGRLKGKSDIEAYTEVGDALNAKGAFNHLFKQEQPETPSDPATPEKKKAAEKKRQSKRRAASPSKSSASPAKDYGTDVLNMSDADFAKQFDEKFL